MTKVILMEIQVKTAENDQLIKWITENENLIFFTVGVAMYNQ